MWSHEVVHKVRYFLGISRSTRWDREKFNEWANDRVAALLFGQWRFDETGRDGVQTYCAPNPRLFDRMATDPMGNSNLGRWIGIEGTMVIGQFAGTCFVA
jgi:hypothetical protein